MKRLFGLILLSVILTGGCTVFTPIATDDTPTDIWRGEDVTQAIIDAVCLEMNPSAGCPKEPSEILVNFDVNNDGEIEINHDSWQDFVDKAYNCGGNPECAKKFCGCPGPEDEILDNILSTNPALKNILDKLGVTKNKVPLMNFFGLPAGGNLSEFEKRYQIFDTPNNIGALGEIAHIDSEILLNVRAYDFSTEYTIKTDYKKLEKILKGAHIVSKHIALSEIEDESSLVMVLMKLSYVTDEDESDNFARRIASGENLSDINSDIEDSIRWLEPKSATA